MEEIEIPFEDHFLPPEEFAKKYGGIFFRGVFRNGKFVATIVPGDWVFRDHYTYIEVWNCEAWLVFSKKGKIVATQEDIEEILEEQGREKDLEKLRELVRGAVYINQSGRYPISPELRKFMEEEISDVLDEVLSQED